jgi:type IV secretory pathway TraG/TraD family ATPase VirD4
VVNTPTSSFDIETIMNQGKILLVNVSQGKLGEDNTALLGAMMITKIQLAAMNRVYMPEEERRDFYLDIDEFQNFATTSFIKILSEARKYRLNLTLANQYIDQIPEEVKAAIFGNAGSILSFILGASDADWMMKEFGGKYTQEDLVSLSRYQIISKLMIDGRVSQPFPASTLDLAASRNQNRDKVIQVSRERYAKRK